MKSLKHYLVPILFICGVVVIIVAIINPTLTKVKLVKQELTQLTEAERQVNELLVIYDSIRQKYQEITETDKITIEKALPSNVNNVRLILELERIAETHNLPLKDVKVALRKDDAQNSDLPDNMRAINVQVTVTGDYESFLKFIGDLERSLRIVTIRNVDFSTDDSDKSKGQTEYTVMMETYWFVYPDVAGGSAVVPTGDTAIPAE